MRMCAVPAYNRGRAGAFALVLVFVAIAGAVLARGSERALTPWEPGGGVAVKEAGGLEQLRDFGVAKCARHTLELATIQLC